MMHLKGLTIHSSFDRRVTGGLNYFNVIKLRDPLEPSSEKSNAKSWQTSAVFKEAIWI